MNVNNSFRCQSNEHKRIPRDHLPRHWLCHAEQGAQCQRHLVKSQVCVLYVYVCKHVSVCRKFSNHKNQFLSHTLR